MLCPMETVLCAQCGKEIPKKKKRHGKYRCLDCGMQALAESIYQQRAKSGPAHEKWEEAMRARFSDPQ